MHFFMHLPSIPPEEHERYLGVWAAFYGRSKPHWDERIYRLLFVSHDGQELVAEVGDALGPGQAPVTCILGGDPLLICRLHGGAIAVPAHRAIDAQFFNDGLESELAADGSDER